MVLVLGIDDAGKGPLIGPMILAGVLAKKEKEGFFIQKGIKDSKLLVHSARLKLVKIIKEHCLNSAFVKVYPEEIDDSPNLNTLEAQKAAELVNLLNSGKYKKEKIKVIVDCPSTNIKKWKDTFLKMVKNTENLDVYCEHKADFNHPIVSAASILAKVTREDEVAKLKKEFQSYGDIGSGYPADPVTQQFLKKNGKILSNSGIFRKSWQTWKDLFPGKEQKTLSEF